MQTFQFLALNQSGETIQGTVDARDRSEAISAIQESQLYPKKVWAKIGWDTPVSQILPKAKKKPKLPKPERKATPTGPKSEVVALFMAFLLGWIGCFYASASVAWTCLFINLAALPLFFIGAHNIHAPIGIVVMGLFFLILFTSWITGIFCSLSEVRKWNAKL